MTELTYTVDLSHAVWRKSSRSGTGSNSACVEITYAQANWRKSSRSGSGSNNNCVEIAHLGPVAAVRDSKNTAGPVLAFSSPTWTGFLANLR